MVSSYENELEQAKKRLNKAKIKIKHNTESTMDEPDNLVSGVLDEVELKRREQGKDTNE
jgi:hypothetical protein